MRSFVILMKVSKLNLNNVLYRFLAQVPADALTYFREAAEALIEERGAVDAVAAALAHISGTTEIKSRSLLSSQEVLGLYCKSLCGISVLK